MLLSKTQNDIRWQIDEVAFRCIHSIKYFDGITGFSNGPKDYWRFSQNCFGEVACLNWCHLFNSENKDPVHYRKLFGNDQLIELDKLFSYVNVKHRLIEAAGLDEQGYLAFRANVIDFRNKFAAHREFTIGSIKFPQLNHAQAMCLEIRDILQETVDAELLTDTNSRDLKDIKKHFSEQSNQWLLKKCDRDIDQLKNIVHSQYR